MVGNKIDLGDKRKVGTEEGQALATELDVHFIETSAKVGINVKNLFKSLAQQLPGVSDGQVPEQKEEKKAGFSLGGG